MPNNNNLTSRAALVSLSALVSAVAIAQDGGATRSWAIEPSVSLRQTFTDNRQLQTVKESDSITEAVAGVRLSSASGRLRGFFDYSLTGSVYAHNGDANELHHSLNSFATAEFIDGQAFVDFRGSYTRQAISAFGSQATTPSLTANNQADVGSVSISPHLRGRLGSLMRYEARLSYETTRAKGTDTGDTDNSAASLHFDDGVSGAALGWSVDATHNVSDFRVGRRTFDSRLRAGLSYVVNSDLKLGLTAGTERTDVRSIDGQSNATYGMSAQWSPTERTLLSAIVEKRYFGTGHALNFSHRTPNTVWTLSDTRDVSNTNSQGNASFGSAYDLFFRQFASIEPDAAKRDVLARNYLQTNGIDPNAVVIGGFLASAATLQRAQSASMALVGVRNTVTARLSQGRTSRADTVTTVLDDLSTAQRVRQRGLSLDWAYRLTQQSTITLGGSYQRSDSDLPLQETTLKAITLFWTGTLGPKSSLSAGARRAEFESATSPYDETAVFAAFRYAF